MGSVVLRNTGNVVFDPARKEEFLNSLGISQGTANVRSSMFVVCGEVESKYGKDISEFDTAQMDEVLINFYKLRNHTSEVYKSYLTSYLHWINTDRSELLARYILETKEEDAIYLLRESFISTGEYISSPRHLEVIVNKIFPKYNYFNIFDIYRSMIWMVYAGIRAKDTVYVEKSDIDLENMVINFDGQTYRIYPEMLSSLRACMENEFIRRRDAPWEKPRARSGGNKVLRLQYRQGSNTLEDSRPNSNTLRNRIKEYIGRYNKENASEIVIRLSKIFDYGEFYRGYQVELCGEFLDLREMAFRRARYNKDVDRNVPDATFSQWVKSTRREYNNWKKVFNLL